MYVVIILTSIIVLVITSAVITRIMAKKYLDIVEQFNYECMEDIKEAVKQTLDSIM